ncbi:hypothetical protein IFO70_07115 [Phormidium tenue FACHB-886]|nr:hypothetical protein [Phormidium tenue FACHB-886]
MNRRPRADSNGRGEANGNGRGHLNGKGALRTEVSRRFPVRPPVRKPASALPVLLVLSGVTAIGIILAIAAQDPLVMPSASPSPVPKAQAFRLGVNRAINAAEVTQTANSKAEWQTIAAWWEEAARLMQSVPLSNPNAAVAQSRIPDYERNLAYAKQQLEQAPLSQFSRALWTKGMRRAEVIRIQGKPAQSERYDALCKEVLYYGGSTVELNNGIVVRYEDTDRNLKASLSELPLVTTVSNTAWTLDSPESELFRIQGTPTRVVRYDSSQSDVLYYSDSQVYVADDRVVGYDNLSNNLRVTVAPSGSNSVNAWSIDSPRDEIFRVQGTPTSVNLDAASCSETLHYGNSSVELRNGFVAGYDDLDGNLRVRVK